MVGATELKSQAADKAIEKDFKGSGSGTSFGKALQDKISLNNPKETKEQPKQEARAKDEKAQAPEQKTERKVDTAPGKEKKAATRQKAIKEFMDSFESEFDIPPTRLVEAMAELDDSQLKESPEATASAVIDQLDLDDADAEKAQAMYASLLTQLQQMPQTPKAAPEMGAGIGMSAQNIQARVAAAQEKQTTMGNAIQNLNQKFWMRQEAPAASPAMPTLDGNLAQRLMMDDSMMNPAAANAMENPMEMPSADMAQAEIPQGSTAKLPELPPHLKGQMNETMSPALLAALAAKQAAAAQAAAGGAKEAAAEESPELADEFMQALEAPRTENPQQLDMMGKPVQAKAEAQEFFQQNDQGQSLMQDSNEFMKQGMAQSKDAAKTKLTTKSAEFKSALSGLEGIHGAPIKGESLKFDAMAPMAPAAPTGPTNPADNEAAVKQVMNQAQYLIKKGGGEVKVQMTPEGMGTIHLKVMLQDGKVNLQMSADTQEAKKTIESSLVDLKNSLAAHKLSVENVKVDVVNAASDTAAQNQANNNSNQGQREARQFWNQFNENFGNQGRRESFTDFQSVKGSYGRRRDPLQPVDTASVKSNARAVEGKGRGLNLVA
ncbi:MAG: flagellar hook-length control protein FliK [Bdellovibrio sp.]|nr:flagellar hook-length control protein FliK [Bdellovibrio sp.]